MKQRDIHNALNRKKCDLHGKIQPVSRGYELLLFYWMFDRRFIVEFAIFESILYTPDIYLVQIEAVAPAETATEALCFEKLLVTRLQRWVFQKFQKAS
jgi:hypothetical protein